MQDEHLMHHRNGFMPWFTSRRPTWRYTKTGRSLQVAERNCMLNCKQGVRNVKNYGKTEIQMASHRLEDQKKMTLLFAMIRKGSRHASLKRKY